MTDSVVPTAHPSGIPAHESLDQRRVVATQIPGPKSQALQEQRTGQVARGLGTVLPVFVERARARSCVMSTATRSSTSRRASR